MPRRPGLPAAAHTTLAERRATRHVTPLIDDTNRIVQLPVTALAPHPDNPRGPVIGDPAEDVSEIADSIRQVGILQPLHATPRAVHLAAHPDHADQLGDATHVVLMGHRRLAAAVTIGLAEVPVIVRTDPADVALDVRAMMIENLHRTGLNPIQEARGYQQLATRGMSQRAIAHALGVSQPQVSRRLKLLQLPAAAQASVAAGRLPVEDALDQLRPARPAEPAPPPAPPPPAAGPRAPSGPPSGPAAGATTGEARAAQTPAPVDRAAAALAAATGNLPRQNQLVAALARAVLRLASPEAVTLAHRWLAGADSSGGSPVEWARTVADTGVGLTRVAWAVTVAADELAGGDDARAAAHYDRLQQAGWSDSNRIRGNR
jgi:ParB family chromosome partitioning protein